MEMVEILENDFEANFHKNQREINNYKNLKKLNLVPDNEN
jgi:hypothetical protein